MSRLINIHSVRVPNPRAMKFEVDGILLTHGAFGYENAEEATDSPLARKLFLFPYVTRVFISKNFVTVTKSTEDKPLWEQVAMELRIVIKKHLESGEPLFDLDSTAAPEEMDFDNTEEGKLKQMMEERIRPATNQDGGDITFGSYSNGILKVNLAGACLECPFAPRTIKAGIEELGKSLVPGLKEVTSDDVNWSETQQEL